MLFPILHHFWLCIVCTHGHMPWIMVVSSYRQKWKMIRWTWANTRKTPKEAQTIIEEWSEWEEGTKWCKWLPACVIIAVFQDLSDHPGGTLGMMSGLWSWYRTRRSWYLRAQPCRGGQYLPRGFEVVLLWGMRWWNKWLWIATDLGGAPTYVILHPLISCYTHSGPVTPLIGTIHTTMLRRKHGTVCWSNASARLDAINLTLTTNPQPPTTATNSSGI